MNNPVDHPRLSTQSHPVGRKELTANTSFLESNYRRAFTSSDISEIFHENTKFNKVYNYRSMKTVEQLPRTVSVIKQDYSGHDTVSLPEAEPLSCDLDNVLSRRRSVRKFSDMGVSKRDLGSLLGHSVRPTETKQQNGITETFRPYPSAGGLFPIDLYPVITNGVNVDEGIYHYSPRDHALCLLKSDTTASDSSGFRGTFLDADFARGVVSDAAITIVLTGNFSRIKVKYGPVGYRFALIEAGHIAQNLHLVAEALGLGSVPLGGFIDQELDDFIGVDGVNESTVYALAIGHPNDE
jgi:SagB-type dehydrogenase family enzyme